MADKTNEWAFQVLCFRLVNLGQQLAGNHELDPLIDDCFKVVEAFDAKVDEREEKAKLKEEEEKAAAKTKVETPKHATHAAGHK